MMKKTTFIFLLQLITISLLASDFEWKSNQNQQIVCDKSENEVVKAALQMYSQDYSAVFGGKVNVNTSKGDIYIGTIGQKSKAEKMLDKNDISKLKEKWEGFIITIRKNKLIVLGSDKRGTAYGILELSRLIGVSPWVWWADSTPQKKEKVELKDDFYSFQYPSVKFRGIFINDEDWGLTPWSYKNFEKSDVKGQIGPKTTAKIFELLLRLRANTYWPPMHGCSVAFYLTPGNKEVADKYGIFIGTSHCEPLMCNANAEWHERGKGEYDYVHNRDNVVNFWEQRVKEVAKSDNIYTLGIRGVHDGKMQGANTVQEQKEAVSKIFVDQRNLLKKYVNSKLEQIPQVFIPYKEVLDVYNDGLKVPDDVTLMWTDDNYGYIRHFPDSVEQKRKGGNGIYYHVSYWGRPHDYLWLSTTSPALITAQMKLAYEKNARQIWILNVGDIKPAEYATELFMDLAWNVNTIESSRESVDNHQKNWLQREFGIEMSNELLKIMTEYYRLAYIRKPEFMGNTRTEEKDPKYKEVKSFPWSEEEINTRLKQYIEIENQVKDLSIKIPENKKNTWFQLIEYPVCASAEMNKKMLYAQLSRQLYENQWTKSDEAYNEIKLLTEKYNSIENGKWKYMMDSQPRELAVFKPVSHQNDTTILLKIDPKFQFYGSEYNSFTGQKPVENGLGYERKAISLQKGNSVEYHFTANSSAVKVQVALAPFLPIEGNKIRFSISIDDASFKTIDFKTFDRNEEWKQNVLRNQSIKTIEFRINNLPKHKITIKAEDEGVVIDQIKIW